MHGPEGPCSSVWWGRAACAPTPEGVDLTADGSPWWTLARRVPRRPLDGGRGRRPAPLEDDARGEPRFRSVRPTKTPPARLLEAIREAAGGPSGAVRCFQRLLALEGGAKAKTFDSFFASHPPTDKRIKAAEKQIAGLGKKGSETNVAGYGAATKALG